MLGSACVEVVFSQDVDAGGVPRLEAQFASAMAHRHHVLLNFGGCEYVSPEVVSLIATERERLAKADLDVMQFGASGILRPLLKAAFEQETSERESAI